MWSTGDAGAARFALTGTAVEAAYGAGSYESSTTLPRALGAIATGHQQIVTAPMLLTDKLTCSTCNSPTGRAMPATFLAPEGVIPVADS